MLDILSLKAGVPQGTKLGPVMFLILINDALRKSGIRYWKYVDDMTVMESRPRSAASQVQGTLDSLSRWCVENEMLLNASKYNAMCVDFGKQGPTPLNLSTM